MRIAYLATADARGHLMRAQLLAKALGANGASVEVLTTSDEGVRFLAGFGIAARLLSRHYAVQFDARQNMLRAATDANVAAYVFRPARMLRDIWRLRAVLRGSDLVVDDSFHPALIVMGALPLWRRKIVHVYGASLRQALLDNFEGRLGGGLAGVFARTVGWLIDRSRARLVHDFAVAAGRRGGDVVYLPTPVATAAASAPMLDDSAAAQRRATVYLNPHFRDPRLAEALERGLADAGWQAHFVGEGFADRAGWLGHDARWIDHAAASGLIVSAPGLAALSVAAVYGRPILLLATDQPEQQRNLARAVEVGLPHRTVAWQGSGGDFAAAVAAAARTLGDMGVGGRRGSVAATGSAGATAGRSGGADAAARLQAWVATLTALAAGEARGMPIENRSCPSHLPP